MGYLDTRAISTIRGLSADTVQKANSGHPGLPLGAAALAFTLWAKEMVHTPQHQDWLNRDRFVLSGGHGSSLLYVLLHLFQYDVSIEDLKQFRQLDSKTPGHPEFGHTPGVEATTGPLGAGMGMAVGMAMAERHLAAKFNKPHYPVVNHYTYVLGGDGCLMEGISSEAFSLAGTLKLDKLIVLYDSNKISIEGSTDIAFTEDVGKRMESFGFQVIIVEDGEDIDAIEQAIELAKNTKDKPSFIEVKTTIGKGCPAKEGTASAHGEPLGVENVISLKRKLGLPVNEEFYVEQEVYSHIANYMQPCNKAYDDWKKMIDDYFVEFPEMKNIFNDYFNTDYAAKLDNNKNFWNFEDKPEATRNNSGSTMNKIKNIFPNFMGGAADLAPSTKTYLNNEGDYSCDNYAGRNIHYGVRELAMAAIGNGIMLHGGIKTFVSTFFVFSDYVKPMARLSALMNLPLTYVLTHDSIGVGEDGPTHEPVEQLTMLRSMPNFNVFRPCDAMETNVGWYLAMTSKSTPTALVLSRQNLPQLRGSSIDALKGGYVIDDCDGQPEVILMASGSEVSLAIEAKKKITNKKVRVVSMPCLDLFKEQSEAYKNEVLPKAVSKRVAIEAGSRMSWAEFVGLEGAYVTMDGFGASAPADQLFEKFGFTVENVVNTVSNL